MTNTSNHKSSSAEITIAARGGNSKRPRSNTMLKLDWLAERVRKVESIKAQVAAGEYRTDSRDVAKALLGMNPERIKVLEA